MQIHVALASALHRASDFSSTAMGDEVRRIALVRSPRPGISRSGTTIALGIDVSNAPQVLPAAVGLLAAWAGVMPLLANHPGS